MNGGGGGPVTPCEACFVDIRFGPGISTNLVGFEVDCNAGGECAGWLSGTIDFGDGDSLPLSPIGCEDGMLTFDHIYPAIGNYDVVVTLDFGGGCIQVSEFTVPVPCEPNFASRFWRVYNFATGNYSSPGTTLYLYPNLGDFTTPNWVPADGTGTWQNFMQVGIPRRALMALPRTCCNDDVLILIAGATADLTALDPTTGNTLYGKEVDMGGGYLIRFWSESFDPAGAPFTPVGISIAQSKYIFWEVVEKPVPPEPIAPPAPFTTTFTLSACGTTTTLDLTISP